MTEFYAYDDVTCLFKEYFSGTEKNRLMIDERTYIKWKTFLRNFYIRNVYITFVAIRCRTQLRAAYYVRKTSPTVTIITETDAILHTKPK